LLFLSGFVARAESTNNDYALGLQQYRKTDWEGAITNFSKSIEAGYDLYDSYCYRAYSRAELKDGNEAVQDCNEVIKLYPGESGYYWRARVEVELTNYDAALSDFALGMQLNTRDKPRDLADELSWSCYRRAMRNMRTNDLESAMTNLNRAIYIMPTNGIPYADRGFLKILQGRFQSAIGDEYFSIKYAPYEPFGYEFRAFARCETEDNSGALEDCTNAMEIYKKWEVDSRKSEPDDHSIQIVSFAVLGLQNFIGGNYEAATNFWTQFLDGTKKLPNPTTTYIEKWIERTKAKEKDRQSVLK
jgi:hypothetical protein